MNAGELLSRLDGVRTTGRDRWIARCPAHRDRSPSLSIRQMPDRVLLHCFGGCSADEVARSLNLEMADLFDTRAGGGSHFCRAPAVPALDVMRCLADDLFLALTYLADISRGYVLTAEDRRCLASIAGRFLAAIQLCHERA